MDHSVQRWVGYDWWWVDTLFMGLASMIQYSARTGDPRFAATALSEYHDTTHGGANASQPGLWDPASNLYWRDHTYINQREPNGAKVFWARGNGWAIAAHALALEALPAAHPAVPELTERLTAMAGALAAVQGADGMWRAALLDPNVDPNPETTGTSAFTFAIAWAVNNNVRCGNAPRNAMRRAPPNHAYSRCTHTHTHTHKLHKCRCCPPPRTARLWKRRGRGCRASRCSPTAW
jgi:rhamnogalacturonyl hydrolase YesR